MTELVSCSYWHHNLSNYMKWYMQGCHTCRQAKHQNQCKLGKLQLIPTPNGPWQWIQSDFVGELLKSDGFNAIYVVSNCLTKMVHFIPTTTNISAPDLMKLHVHHIWKLHGIPLIQWPKKLIHKRSNFACESNCSSGNKGKPVGIYDNKAMHLLLCFLKAQNFSLST